MPDTRFGGQNRTRNRRGAESRERILRAAYKVVANHPVAQVKITTVAREAGVTSGNVLYHFPSRDDLLLGTLIWCERQLIEIRDRALARAASREERLAAYVRVYLATSSRDVYWKLWLEYWLMSARAASQEDEVTRSGALTWLAQARELIADGIQAGAYRDVGDVREFVETYTSLLDGLSVHVLMHRMTGKQALAVALEEGSAKLGCELRLPRGPQVAPRP